MKNNREMKFNTCYYLNVPFQVNISNLFNNFYYFMNEGVGKVLFCNLTQVRFLKGLSTLNRLYSFLDEVLLYEQTKN